MAAVFHIYFSEAQPDATTTVIVRFPEETVAACTAMMADFNGVKGDINALTRNVRSQNVSREIVQHSKNG